MSIPGTAPRARVLFFCSSFFSYPASIRLAFERLGFDVTWLDDRASNSVVYKGALRLFPRWTSRLSTRHFAAAIDKAGEGVERIVVIKGEGLSREATQHLRERFPGAHMSMYLWDSAANSPNSVRAASLYDAVHTFDPDDAQTYGWEYRPLFAGTQAESSDTNRERFEWSFIGTIHSDRYRVLKKFSERSKDQPHFIFGYFPSKLLYYGYALRNPSLMKEPSANFSRQPLSAPRVREVMSASNAILDVEHPRQAGLTLRTVETLLAGRKLITTNRRILGSKLYDPSRVCIIDRHDPVVPADFFEIPSVPVPEPVRYEYSLECWAKDVLGLPRDNANPASSLTEN